MSFRCVLGIAALATGVLAAQPQTFAPNVLPAMATAKLAQSLQAARAHTRHVWRDNPPKNPDGTINGTSRLRAATGRSGSSTCAQTRARSIA